MAESAASAGGLMPKPPPGIPPLAGAHSPTAIMGLVALMRGSASPSIRKHAARTWRAHMDVVRRDFPTEAGAIAAEIEAVLGSWH